jgi:hypothetical protein
MHSRNTSSLNLVLALLCSPDMDIYTKYWRWIPCEQWQ